MWQSANVSDLVGKTLSEAYVSPGKDEVRFVTVGGEHFRMAHSQSCCEHVVVEDVCGDLADLVGSPILKAEESTSGENPEGVTKEYQDSFTWTFYHFATVKGYVTIRWYGESNGYYSEGVDFERLDKGDDGG